MSQDSIFEKTTVVGAGLMGGQIGLVMAAGSRETVLMSRRTESLDRALEDVRRYAETLHEHGQMNRPQEVTGRIRTTTDLGEALEGASFVVESIPEDLEQKQLLFRRMDELAPLDAVLASNTSGLPITQIAARAMNRHRIVGSHFVQPAHIVPVVEVVRGQDTSEDVFERTCAIWERLNKIPLRVNRDIPGFLVNRLQHALIREAVRLLASGVASAAEIDMAVQLGLAPRFTTAGPLKQRDINGLDTHARVARHLWPTLDGWQEALAYVQQMVTSGETGLEAGKGYYDWSDTDPVGVRREKDRQLLRRTREVMADWAAERT